MRKFMNFVFCSNRAILSIVLLHAIAILGCCYLMAIGFYIESVFPIAVASGYWIERLVEYGFVMKIKKDEK